MTHTFIAIDNSKEVVIMVPCDNFGFQVEGLSENYDKWATGVCRAGGEQELIKDMLWLLDNPEPIGYDYSYEDQEPEYTLAGGYAAYDA